MINAYHQDLRQFEFDRMPDHRTECKELRRAKRGDAAALDNITRRYQLYLIKLCNRFAGRFMSGDLGPDLMGVANMGLMEAIKTFKPHPGARFQTWVYLRVRRRVLEFLSREVRHRTPKGDGVAPEQYQDAMHDRVDPTFSTALTRESLGPADIALEGRDRIAHLNAALRRLNRKQLRLLRMRYVMDLTYDEIAARSKPRVGRSTIAARLEMVLNRLREHLLE